ncbi:RNA polymerase sigma factor [Glutamicibacter sp. PS]|uniref:RNA polymerase sigma factor n=1 Tax=Glutamicibacter sp. PS TaxID=3075634 RepID=UPI00284CF6C1|nr:RNA polymerase sigma factor [Glutamicibacter sp. PS]MDR4533111.1 RNA polymerase sigma factor [Glutamicibacter sp. PS]
MSSAELSSDSSLLEAAREGHGESFAVLFDRHRGRVFRHVIHVVRDPDIADEITAMVFYEAWRRNGSIRVVDGSIVAWLLLTANYTIKNVTRQQRRYATFLAHLPAPEHVRDVANEVVDDDALTTERQHIRQAFGRLKATHRNVLTLCVLEEFSTRDAASALQVAEGTVKSRLSRAKETLRKHYVAQSNTGTSERNCALSEGRAQ